MQQVLKKVVFVLILGFMVSAMPRIWAKTTTYEFINEKPHTNEIPKRSGFDLPAELRPICGCESSYEGTAEGEPRQFNKDGSPRENKNYDKLGNYKSSDWGACQINDKTWSETAQKLDLDYKHKKADNYSLATHILRTAGIEQWKNSGKCWK